VSQENAPFLLFEDSLKQEAFYFSNPVEEIVVFDVALVGAAFERLDQLRKQGLYVAGFVAYEAGYSFFPATEVPVKKSQQPLLHFYAFSKKHHGRPKDFPLDSPSSTPFDQASSVALTDFAWDTSLELYSKLQSEICEHLFSGDIYQQNQTVQLSFSCEQSARELYLRLRTLQKTHYTAFLNFPDYQILSFSPELFYKKSGENIFVEPMKGTLSVSEDAELLKNDEKNISENLMIVDLLRNDLGKIAHPGSVEVSELFRVQTLETVHQMTSKISAKIDRDTSVLMLFQSLFPCGSITGAPKWSAMQFINSQEVSARGVYTGAIGYIEPNNDQCFNVAIRTIVAEEGRFTLGVGGGIIVDSEVQSEFDEVLLKSRFVRKLNGSFYLFETFLFDGQACRDLDLHLQRLQRSAQDLGFEMNGERLRQTVMTRVEGLSSAYKVKIKLQYDGEFEIKISDLEIGLAHGIVTDLADSRTSPETEIVRDASSRYPQSDISLNEVDLLLNSEKPRQVALSPQKINSQSIFQKHKTSNREVYDAEFTRAQQRGLYDLVFLNERDEVAEASRHNIFIKVNGQWKTPPLSSGALPGIARQRAVAELSAKEEVLFVDDLRTAEEILLTNSVRGRVSVLWSEL
jgi:para-aminobenzoate synthetase / 4-amino-4-deoxychorismate lyase